MEQIAERGFGEIVASVAGAIEQAIKDHGAGAVELALLAYQVSAIQSLIFGTLYLIATGGGLWAYMKLWKSTEEAHEREFPRFIGGMVAAVWVGGFAIAAFDPLLRATNWLAAFGHPELLIATRALQAAGLM